MNSKLQALALAGSAVLAVSLGATPAQAAPATAQAQAKAKILKQLTISKNTDLNFGTIVSGVNAGTVAIAANGNRTCDTTNLTCTGATTAANFTVAGTNNTVVTVAVPASVSLTGPTGSTPMTATLSAPTTLALGNSGASGTPLAFGGTLSIAANQADGEYSSANFAVTVDYQ